MKNNESKLFALELADEVIELVEASGPHGLRFIDGAAALGVDYNTFYGAVHQLAALGRVKVGRGCDGHKNRVLLPDAVEPDDIWLSENQRKVLVFLHENANDLGLCQASSRTIAKATGVSCPAFCIERLDLKGYIDFAELGSPTKATTYKVYPDGTGMKSDTWWYLKYGHRKMMAVAREWAETPPEERHKFIAEFDQIEQTLRAGR